MNKLDRICDAIREYEGWKPGSRSYRNCNPGNLRGSSFDHKMEEGYCVFPTFAMGWNALVWDIECKCKGRTRTSLTPSSTIEDLFKVYAPEQDSNNPASYCAFVCRMADVNKEDPLSSILIPD